MIYTKSEAIQIEENGLEVVRIENVELFDVSKVFDCGQCFRFDPVTYTRHEKEFAGCAHGKYISVAQDGDTVYVYNTDVEEYESLWRPYLGLDRDYGEINRSILSLTDNSSLADAVERSSGIRILKQDCWEAVCSFIISQNNNIPRIKKLIAAISRTCGSKVDVSGMENHIADAHRDAEGHFYNFPTPESLVDLGIWGLAELKTGFRAKYIFDAAQRVSSGELDLSKIESLDTKKAIDALCSVKGIGTKVASCALLFGFSKLDAFPVDVWIKKVMAKYFDEGFEPSTLGEFAGIAQQYLFYYERYLQSKGL